MPWHSGTRCAGTGWGGTPGIGRTNAATSWRTPPFATATAATAPAASRGDADRTVRRLALADLRRPRRGGERGAGRRRRRRRRDLLDRGTTRGGRPCGAGALARGDRRGRRHAAAVERADTGARVWRRIVRGRPRHRRLLASLRPAAVPGRSARRAAAAHARGGVALRGRRRRSAPPAPVLRRRGPRPR